MGTFADCTYCKSSKAWKVTIVRTECDGSAFQRHFLQDGPPETFYRGTFVDCTHLIVSLL